MVKTPALSKPRSSIKSRRRDEDFIPRLFITLFVILVDAVMLYPIINVISISLSSYTGYLSNPIILLPTDFSLAAYGQVFQYSLMLSGYAVTLFVTIFGTVLGVLLTILTAYPLSKKQFRGKGFFMGLILFTMFFSGGMIPSFLLIKTIGLLDTVWSLILPSCLSAYNVILMRNFFTSLPDSLIEAAEIDGASEPFILFRIVVPLSKPIISTILLFVAVGYWNSYFNAVLYIRSRELWPLQLVLREIIMSATALNQSTGGNIAEIGNAAVQPIMLQYASIVVAMVPILCIYPFLQKYFEKGIMMGAVKG